jgi:ABC-type transporter Mla subunit MlaD
MAKTKFTSSFMIGLFVLVGIGLFIGAVIWLGKDKISEEASYYVTYFEDSIDGLTIGTAVKYQGINCGSISELNIAHDGKLIEVVMLLNPELEVTENMRAQAAMSGIAGGKFVLLYYPKSQRILNAHPKLDFEIEYPRIKSAPSELADMAVAAQDIVSRLNQVEYIKITEKLYEMLDSMVVISGSLNKLVTNKNIYNTLDQLSMTSEELTGIVKKIDSLKVYKELENTAYNLDKMSQNILAISEKIDNKVEEIEIQDFLTGIESTVDTTAQTANAAINTINYQSVNVMYSLTEMIEELKTTNKDLQNTLRAFTEAPTHTLFSKPPEKDDR